MEVAETNAGSAVSKVSESTQEVSTEKASSASIKQAVSSESSKEQSVVQEVEKSVMSSSSVSDDKEKSETVKENGESGAKPSAKLEESESKKKSDAEENVEVIEEVIEVEGSEDGEEVEETVVIVKKKSAGDSSATATTTVKTTKTTKSTAKPTVVEETIEKHDDGDENVTVQVKLKPPAKKEPEKIKQEEKPEPVKEAKPKEEEKVEEEKIEEEEEEEEEEEVDEEEVSEKKDAAASESKEDVQSEAASVASGPKQSSEIKQENIKNTLKEIISDIDRVIEQEEEEATDEDKENKGAVAELTTDEAKDKEAEAEEAEEKDETPSTTTLKATPPFAPNINRYISKSHRSMSLPAANEILVKDPSGRAGPQKIDLQKLFTPATDAEEILPKNRKLYASSAFYSPNLHPTVEDQVELARRISHSLSDISNHQSKGQTMYVNRKKRSVKWVHEGEGRAHVQQYNGYSEETKENGYQTRMSSSYQYHNKMPLKLVMDPRGQVQDFTSTRQQSGYNIDVGLLSPENCAELVTALHAPRGKGAELFAKRRKKSEKWIIDETNAATRSPSGVSGYPHPTSPLVPAYSDVGVQRVQLNMHQDQIQDKYSQPRVKLVRTPWDAALETGSAANAFQELPSQRSSFNTSIIGGYDYAGGAYSPTGGYQTSIQPEPAYQPQYESSNKTHSYVRSSQSSSTTRDLAYKPSIPQGWNAPPASLPKDLYVPPEIPLDSYVPPAKTSSIGSSSYLHSTSGLSSNYGQSLSQSQSHTQPPTVYVEPAPPSSFPAYEPITQPSQSSFPTASKPYYSPQSQQSAHQQYSSTLNRSSNLSTNYNQAKLSHNATPAVVGTAFNPSPLPYEKLAKFENPNEYEYGYNSHTIRRPLAIPANSKVRNVSPTPFLSSSLPSTNKSYQHVSSTSTVDNYYSTSSNQHQSSSSYPQQLSPVTTGQYQTYGGGASTGGIGDQSNVKSTTIVDSYQQHSSYSPYDGSSSYSSSYHQQYNTPPPSCGSTVNMSNCQNYNTAARGWGQMRDYYRPITFSKQTSASSLRNEMPYTDF